MANLQKQLHEDRIMRDAAKRLVKADVAFVKSDFSQKGVGGRLADRAKDGAAELSDSATEFADTHRAQIGTGIVVAAAAFAGWIYRDLIADTVYDLFHDKGPMERATDKAEQFARYARSFFE